MTAITAPPMSISAEKDPRRWWALIGLTFALFMALLDNTVVNVALPHIQRSLHTSISDLQWIVSGYSLVFGALLITGGKVGDIIGRRRVFIGGLFLFTLASALCGVAPNVTALHIFRALQGIGGAAIFPLTLAIINTTFEGKERATAISVWGAVAGLAIALGPVLGGLLVDNVSWRAVFFINLPVGIVAATIVMLTVKESRDTEGNGRIDWFGALLSIVALFAIIYALIQTGASGWGWGSRNNVLTLAGGILLVIAFIGFEWQLSRRGGEPMIELSFFQNPAFNAVNAVAFLLSLGMFASFFYLSLYLQTVLGYSALGAGLRTLPIAVGIFVGSPLSAQLAGRYGPRWPLALGLLLAAGSIVAWGLLLTPTTGYSHFAWVFPVFGFGMGMVFPAIGTAVLNAVPARFAGVATGLNDMSREVGGTFGIAVMAAIFNPVYHSSLVSNAAKAGISANAVDGLRSGAANMPPATLAAAHRALQASYVDATHPVLYVGALLLLLGAVVAIAFSRGGAHGEQAGASDSFSTQQLEPAAAD
jgi:EmrB/QacA subfamily drug resistance transporter